MRPQYPIGSRIPLAGLHARAAYPEGIIPQVQGKEEEGDGRRDSRKPDS